MYNKKSQHPMLNSKNIFTYKIRADYSLDLYYSIKKAIQAASEEGTNLFLSLDQKKILNKFIDDYEEVYRPF